MTLFLYALWLIAVVWITMYIVERDEAREDDGTEGNE